MYVNNNDDGLFSPAQDELPPPTGVDGPSPVNVVDMGAPTIPSPFITPPPVLEADLLALGEPEPITITKESASVHAANRVR